MGRGICPVGDIIRLLAGDKGVEVVRISFITRSKDIAPVGAAEQCPLPQLNCNHPIISLPFPQCRLKANHLTMAITNSHHLNTAITRPSRNRL